MFYSRKSLALLVLFLCTLLPIQRLYSEARYLPPPTEKKALKKRSARKLRRLKRQSKRYTYLPAKKANSSKAHETGQKMKRPPATKQGMGWEWLSGLVGVLLPWVLIGGIVVLILTIGMFWFGLVIIGLILAVLLGCMIYTLVTWQPDGTLMAFEGILFVLGVGGLIYGLILSLSWMWIWGIVLLSLGLIGLILQLLLWTGVF